MLNSGKKIRTLHHKKNKYSNSCVVRKKILNVTKNHNPPLQVKWSVPYINNEFICSRHVCFICLCKDLCSILYYTNP